jgi:hypothetical protein
MKQHSTFQSSQNLLGALLLLSLLATATSTSLDVLTDLLAACKSQWLGFSESLSALQPHRTVFPN